MTDGHTPSDDHAQRGLAPFGHTRIDLLARGVDLLDPAAIQCADFGER